KNRETEGIFGTGCAIVIPSHATLSQLPSGQGCAPTPSTPYQRHVKTTYARFWQSTDQGDGLRSIKRQKRAQNASERLKTKKRANPCLFLKITLEHF
ncbi:TPA: hypothetical protein ACNUHM_004529, partial [Salmonella enterica subsp. enterica serovar Derby]